MHIFQLQMNLILFAVFVQSTNQSTNILNVWFIKVQNMFFTLSSCILTPFSFKEKLNLFRAYGEVSSLIKSVRTTFMFFFLFAS